VAQGKEKNMMLRPWRTGRAFQLGDIYLSKPGVSTDLSPYLSTFGIDPSKAPQDVYVDCLPNDPDPACQSPAAPVQKYLPYIVIGGIALLGLFLGGRR
jgi:hypothetical protein